MKVSVILGSLLLLFISAAAIAQQQQPPAPYVDTAVIERLDKATGFNSDKVTRHFYLLKNGGAVEVSAKNPDDQQTIKAIRAFLKKEQDAWTKGNIEMMNATYGRIPDGSVQLKKLRDQVTFAAVDEDNGAVLRLLTVNAQAKSAIYDFLRFQINTLKTGDPTEPQE